MQAAGNVQVGTWNISHWSVPKVDICGGLKLDVMALQETGAARGGTHHCSYAGVEAASRPSCSAHARWDLGPGLWRWFFGSGVGRPAGCAA